MLHKCKLRTDAMQLVLQVQLTCNEAHVKPQCLSIYVYTATGAYKQVLQHHNQVEPASQPVGTHQHRHREANQLDTNASVCVHQQMLTGQSLQSLPLCVHQIEVVEDAYQGVFQYHN